MSWTPQHHGGVSFFLGADLSSNSPHCAAVQSLAVPSNADDIVLTASRDSTLKQWRIAQDSILVENTFRGHTDWLTHVSVWNYANQIVTTSCDQTLKLWSLDSGECIKTVRKHSDYVEGLALAQNTNLAASAGLDNQVFVWDLERLDSPIYDLASKNNKAIGSCYCVDMNNISTVLVTGSTDMTLRLWDPKSGMLVEEMFGHEGNIRDVVLNAAGTMCISASSDNTVRLWDLGTRRCIQEFVPLQKCSVWTLAATSTLDVVYAAGNAQHVAKVDLDNGNMCLVANVDKTDVSKMLLHDDKLWVATVEGTIVCVDVSSTSTPHNPDSSIYGPVCACPPYSLIPSKSIDSRPSVSRAALLNDGRRVVVEDSAGNVDIWDVIMQSRVEQCGQVNFNQVVARNFIKCSLPNWFKISLHLGSLGIYLNKSSAFSAIQHQTANSDESSFTTSHLGLVNSNLGCLALQHLFHSWSKAEPPNVEVGAREARSIQKSTSPTSPTAKSRKKWFGFEPSDISDMESSSGQATINIPSPVRASRGNNTLSTMIIVEQCSENEGMVPRLLNQYDPNVFDRVLPDWILNVVKLGIKPNVKTYEAKFSLLPHSADDLPELPSGNKIKAEDCISARLIADYLITNLHDLISDHEFTEYACGNEMTKPPEEIIFLICGDKVMPATMSVRTAKRFLWKGKSDVFTIHYCRPQYWRLYQNSLK